MNTIKTAETAATTGTVTLTPPRPLWRNRDYLLLRFGETVSEFGSQASALALPLLILATTGSPAQAGLLGGLRGAAYLLFGLPAGALVDRWNRRVVMVVSDTIRAIAMASIPLALVAGRLTAMHLYAVSFTEGTLFIFFGLAATPSMTRIVAKAQLPTAVSQGQAIDAAAGMGGPPLGGILFGVSRMFPFMADAVSYAVSVVTVLCIRAPLTGERVARRQHLRTEIGEGFTWMHGQRVVQLLTLVSGGVNLLYGGYTLLLISLAQRQGASPTTIGLIFTTGGIGTIIGVAMTPWVQRRFTVGQIMVGIGWLFAITWPPYAFASNPFTLGFVNAIGFLFVPIYSGTHFAYRLMLIPEPLQGRVNSINRLVTFGCQALGFVLMGALIQWYGPISTVWITTVPATLLALLITLSATLRTAGKVADAA